jgi:hypothetical protein
VPGGLLRKLQTPKVTVPPQFAEDAIARAEVERLAMEAVFAAERALGFVARDVSAERIGYDIESRDPKAGHLRFIEVKGRVDGAETVTITCNEIRTALNKPDAFILAIVTVSNGFAHEPQYIRRPFQRKPDTWAASVNYHLKELIAFATKPN